MAEDSRNLKYGCNPHQVPARVYSEGGLPFRVLNGNPGYINLLDALNGWQLVRELKQVLNLPAAASFKHVSPSGAAVGLPLSEELRDIYFISPKRTLSSLACAYARARGADRMASYGDWIALSDTVDVETARIIQPEVSDGVIAPGFSADALAIFSKKKRGAYPIIEIDAHYSAPEQESREVFGVTFEQARNHVLPRFSLFTETEPVTAVKAIPKAAQRDLLVATIALKYTQSNSVALSLDGQTIGIGAGQQSRIHCTRLACDKADRWLLRQHPKARALAFHRKVGRPVRDTLVEKYVGLAACGENQVCRDPALLEPTEVITRSEKERWLADFRGMSIASDAYFPFRDNIDRAAASGVRYVLQPGESLRDDDVTWACNEHGIAMVFSGLRLFHH